MAMKVKIFLCLVLPLLANAVKPFGPAAANPKPAHNHASSLRKSSSNGGPYKPNWESLNKRGMPEWFDKAKFGIFIHWGVYSVPAWGCDEVAGEWYWQGLDIAKKPCMIDFHTKTYGQNFKYQDFAAMFKAELFDANIWANVLKGSGAQYVVFTSKHHDGFTHWQSAQSWNWNSVDVGPHRDIVAELTAAVRNQNLTMGLYHSLYEWFHPLYLQDVANGGKTTDFVDQVLHPQMKDIITKYQPDVLWTDGDWDMSDKYWKSEEFIAWLYNESPVKDSIVINDRWGSGNQCQETCIMTVENRPGHFTERKWEDCHTIGSSWGYNRHLSLTDYQSTKDILYLLSQSISYNGNLLLNIGPHADGTIPIVFQERLAEIGQWLSVNGEAIFASHIFSKVQSEAQETVFYTSKDNESVVYVTFFNWPERNILNVMAPNSKLSKVTLLGHKGDIDWGIAPQTGRVLVSLPALTPANMPCKHAWTVKMVAVTAASSPSSETIRI